MYKYTIKNKTYLHANLHEVDYFFVAWPEERKANLLICPSVQGDATAKYQGCTKNIQVRPFEDCSI
jgi:hypothetical protein